MESSQVIKERVGSIKKVLNNPVTLAIIIIVCCAFLIRIYYFNETRSQPVWWDEAEYMSAAKHWAFGVPYDLNPQRPPLFQAIAALFFSLGLGEISIKFFLSMLPSVFLVYAVYLLGTEMFNKKTGLIAALLTAVSWTFLFWSVRIQPDFISMSFQVLSVLFMWKHWKGGNVNYVIYSGIFAALGFYFKVSALLVPMIFIVFIFMKDRFAAIKDKHYYYFSAAFLATLVPYFIWAKMTFGSVVAFKLGYVTAVNEFPIGWYNINFYYSLTENLTFVLFIIGAIIGLKFLLYLDVLAKDKQKCFDPNLFSITALLFISAFYIFYMRNTDDRWVFLWMPFIFFLAAQPLILAYNKLSKKQMFAGMAVVIILLGFCAYQQVQHATSIIDGKKDSYGPVKDASLWIKDHSQKNDRVLSISYTQAVYYTERNVTTYSGVKNTSDLDNLIIADRPRFIMISLFENHPAWVIQQGSQQGYDILAMNYLNSTLVTKNGQIVTNDLKMTVNKGFATFNLVYPQSQINGMFVYEISYPNNAI